jgi:DNA-binding response OmpR family regulator
MRELLRQRLAKHYRLVIVANGRQALDAARRLAPDLMLLDIMMPEMDGIEVCRALRQEPATLTTPIILLTARADEATKLAALADGATDFLHKPFSITELNLRVQNHMALHLSERE